MGSIKGKLEVGLYADANPMVQGFKKGEEAAKRASGSIGDSIDKINKKQLKNIGAGLLGNLGVLGALDAGTKIADEMVKGFQDGSIKGFGGAIEALGETIVKNLENIPIGGALGRLIAAGVDAVSGGTMSQEGKQQGSRGEYDEKNKAAIEFARIKKIRDDADLEMAKKLAEPGIKAAQEEQKIREKFDAQQKSSLKEIQEIKDDLRHATMSERDIEIERIQALPQLLQRQKDEAIAIYDQLQATKARIDAEKQLAETKAKAHQDDISNFAKAQEQQDKAAEDYKTALEENKQQAAMASTNTDVSTALGSIKVAGTSTMNTQKIAEDSLSVQRKQLDEAIKLTSQFKQLIGAP